MPHQQRKGEGGRAHLLYVLLLCVSHFSPTCTDK
jgi:hypothetical protein